MVQVTSREFRDKQAAMFDLADSGEQVIIRRRGKMSYMLIPVHDQDFTITPELQARMEESRRQIKEGNCISFKNAADMQKWLEEL